MRYKVIRYSSFSVEIQQDYRSIVFIVSLFFLCRGKFSNLMTIFEIHVFCLENSCNSRRACGHVDVGTCPHQVLAPTLTLSQPGEADYAHAIMVSTPSIESHRRA